MLFAFGLVAVALLHGMATAAAVSEALFFTPVTGAGRADTGSGNIRGRFLLYRFDGRVLAGFGLPEGRQLYGPILCYGWKGNNIQPMSKDVQAEMLDRLKGTEVRV